jgi:hypothetical protein
MKSIRCGVVTITLGSDPRIERSYLLQSNIPSALQFLRHETILRIGSLILAFSSLCAIARCLQVTV